MSFSTVFKADILKGRTALVTGGGSGICKAVAHALGRHGANVFITSRNAERLQEAAREMGADGVNVGWHAGDVRKPPEVEATIHACREKFGGVDILVNGAAGNFLCPAGALSYNAFKTVVDIDLDGTFNMCKAAFELLQQSKHACVINISATLHYGATPLMLHASAAKAGVDALTRNLGVEWGPLGIRVNGIAPGPIAGTEGMDRLAPGEMGQKLAARIPLGRFGRLEEIGDAAVFLASDAASYINGTTLVVDGGAWMVGRLHLDEMG
ncbi:MAG: SDR family oxidoreductase [Myxococcota bacterium]